MRVLLTGRPEVGERFEAWTPTSIEPDMDENLADLALVVRARLVNRSLLQVGEDLEAAVRVIVDKSKVGHCTGGGAYPPHTRSHTLHIQALCSLLMLIFLAAQRTVPAHSGTPLYSSFGRRMQPSAPPTLTSHAQGQFIFAKYAFDELAGRSWMVGQLQSRLPTGGCRTLHCCFPWLPPPDAA